MSTPDGTSTRVRDELLGIYRRSLAQVQGLFNDMFGEDADSETTMMLAALITLGPRPTEDYDLEAERLAEALEDLYDEDSPEYTAVMERARWDPMFVSRITPVMFCYQEMARACDQLREWDEERRAHALVTDRTLQATTVAARMVEVAERDQEVGLYAHAWNACYQFLMNHPDGARMVVESVFDTDAEE